MGLIVQKFGGTSVGTPERILAVADRIASVRRQGKDLVVVVSAMGHTTDELIDLAHRVSARPPAREMDMLLTTGERISMALLSMALAEKGVEAVSFTGSQSGIITDGSHRRARIRRILGDRVRSAVADGKVAIVAGFQGVSESKEITTLGRGGSDTTAVALASALGAEACEIYTDVDGIYSADPRVVREARFWPRIPADLMAELAHRGAGVLHPRSVELAHAEGVCLRVRNSFNTNEGTEVMVANAKTSGLEEFRIAGVTWDAGKAWMSIELMRPTVVGAVWDVARQAHLTVLGPIFSDGRIQLFTDRDSEPEWSKALQRLITDGFVKGFRMDSEIVPLSVVGSRFAQDGAALYEVTETLAESGILVTMGAASALSALVAVPRSRANDGVQALHARFFGGDTAS